MPLWLSVVIIIIAITGIVLILTVGKDIPEKLKKTVAIVFMSIVIILCVIYIAFAVAFFGGINKISDENAVIEIVTKADF